MTSKEFIIWLRGFITGSNNYNLTPSGWEALKNNLEKVNDYKVSPCVGHEIASWEEEELAKRMDIIGQNGNEGLHYNIDPEHESKKIY
jgi:DNA-binding PadR family transcriptional regulator